MNDNARKYDLEKRLIAFAVSIINVAEALPDNRIGSHVAGQMLRSGTSAAPNYGEAQSAESRKDFIHKMKIALKELRETRVWLMIALQKSLCRPSAKVECLLSECIELIRIFAKNIKTAESVSK